eukprot:CAMPEP_0175892806 /NCGR_PEP_ID=MMETSP0107_2-20121207/49116_1 /TAXON_ID=195067 ORGANISM="Goniomonas pacifica, Strain CCMP1869" /NCGR_SAMPLE_ID=MMETSP0107_2 /ASSEMBLY_ACC=CAM_ASM_000203 /LENGTH=95 /DNA_ID=CAMNT_0017213779 /DNA_START=812 /DNA_END=1096 /DNA_ORIENTATION=+
MDERPRHPKMLSHLCYLRFEALQTLIVGSQSDSSQRGLSNCSGLALGHGGQRGGLRSETRQLTELTRGGQRRVNSGHMCRTQLRGLWHQSVGLRR